mmetsp:Transcript_17563/g.38007  ORF Transcript_17563/g.38007 Transcript_17563/m.38007 type:complete len:442 (+) Transcript_17563:179-1504(+)|eukprot:CAMPEP_0172555340 /NCGR_PEP_ID=MMETSP1067-20121228/58363_1 /TAXON_ID=265564 ORGANISM="Thalassiosira punctigera, Strain Tpunct2005C2" /NCGR_SAMPLE_ID=MMETSP1067 /ASSEMBLY_ACC=CAM_ASM_000444 /LENGTH=441 /DNA_ID=CAMNT_0013343855 /DNA_START=103 /DNA_END=1428 /DNA_ORIENTATION=+
MKILLIVVRMMQYPLLLFGVNAYSLSSGSYRIRRSAALPTALQSKCERYTLSRYHWSGNVNSHHTHLFGAGSDDVIWVPANETMAHDKSSNSETANDVETNVPKVDSEAIFHNLLPSTMGKSRVVRRPATGISSAVLLPLSESIPPEQNAPLFQANISPLEHNMPKKETSMKERLVDVSNLASLLCVLDCTLLPLVSIAIPALSWGVGFVAGSGVIGSSTTGSNSIPAALSSFLAYLPALSHGIALYFVIPVGLLTTIVNYFFGHKEVRFSLLSFLGVALIYVANSSAGIGIPSADAWLHSLGIVAAKGSHAHGGHIHDACGAVVGAATGMMAHTCPEGLAHRMTNTLGCAFLLGSNYYSKKYMEDKSQGCAASALAEAWGGDGGGRAACPPGCNCGAPIYGTSVSSSSKMGGETFFQWESTKGGRGGGQTGGRTFTRWRR